MTRHKHQTRSVADLNRRRFLTLSSIGLGAVGVPLRHPQNTVAHPSGKRAHRRVQSQGTSRVIYGYGAEAVTLHPGDAIDRPSFDVTTNIFDGLVELDATGSVQPALATDWTISDDNLTWTFSVRDGVTFHDGTPLDAEAIKFNFDQILDEGNDLGGYGQWEPLIAEVNALGDLQLEIVTKQPAGGLLDLLASGYGGIASPAALEEQGAEFGRNPVGAGPFRFVRWEQGERIVLEQYSEYWGGAPAITELEFRVISQDAARVLALEAGDVNVISNVGPQSIPVLRENADLTVRQEPTYRVFYWAFNNTKEVFSDPQVRQAFNYAIDRQALVEFVLQGVGQPADAPIPPSVTGYEPIGTYTYDPDRATELLSEAGFPEDWEGVAYVTEGRYYLDRQVAEAIQGMLSNIGVNVRLEVMEWGAFVDAIWSAPADSEVAQARDFAQTAYGTADPGQTFRSTLFSTYWPPAGYNEALFADEAIDQLIEAVEQSVSEDERIAATQSLSEAIFEAAPWIFSHFEQQVVAHQASIEGLEVLPSEYLRFRNVQLAD